MNPTAIPVAAMCSLRRIAPWRWRPPDTCRTCRSIPLAAPAGGLPRDPAGDHRFHGRGHAVAGGHRSDEARHRATGIAGRWRTGDIRIGLAAPPSARRRRALRRHRSHSRGNRWSHRQGPGSLRMAAPVRRGSAPDGDPHRAARARSAASRRVRPPIRSRRIAQRSARSWNSSHATRRACPSGSSRVSSPSFTRGGASHCRSWMERREVSADAVLATASATADLWRTARAEVRIAPGSLAAAQRCRSAGCGWRGAVRLQRRARFECDWTRRMPRSTR